MLRRHSAACGRIRDPSAPAIIRTCDAEMKNAPGQSMLPARRGKTNYWPMRRRRRPRAASPARPKTAPRPSAPSATVLGVVGARRGSRAGDRRTFKCDVARRNVVFELDRPSLRAHSRRQRGKANPERAAGTRLQSVAGHAVGAALWGDRRGEFAGLARRRHEGRRRELDRCRRAVGHEHAAGRAFLADLDTVEAGHIRGSSSALCSAVPARWRRRGCRRWRARWQGQRRRRWGGLSRPRCRTPRQRASAASRRRTDSCSSSCRARRSRRSSLQR